MPTMTDHEVQKIVRSTVRETLISLGADPDNPIEMQRDFQHLRQWRGTVETAKRQGIITGVAILVTGVFATIWVAIKGA